MAEYRAFRTVPTSYKDSLWDILCPQTCHGEAFNIHSSKIREVTTGIKESANTSVQFQGWSGPEKLNPKEYIKSLAKLKNVDNLKGYFTFSRNPSDKVEIQFRNTRANLELGLCFESIIDPGVVELFFKTYGRVQIRMEIPLPINIRAFMMDQNQFNGIVSNEDLFIGDKIFDNIVSMVVYPNQLWHIHDTVMCQIIGLAPIKGITIRSHLT